MQNKFKTRFFTSAFVVVLGLFFSSFVSFAAQNASENYSTLISCNQYYKFGSIDIAVSPTKQTYYPGETIALKGTLTNNNSYPIVDGEVYAKIYRVDQSNGGNPSNGHFEIAEFSGLQNISIGANQKKDIIFTHKLPSTLSKGDYLVHLFFDVAEKYNLAGLSFHAAMPGSITQFRVESSLDKTIYLDKDNITVNGEKYNFRAPNNQESKDNSISIKIPIVNPTNQIVTVELDKELYFWDALNDKNKIQEEKEHLTVPANGKNIVEYLISKPIYAVYFLKLTANSNLGDSVVDVRPIVRDVSEPRLNFPALASFPLLKGQKTLMFSCFHNASSIIEKGELVMTLKDSNGNLIASKTFEGDIYPNMLATAQEFTPQQDYSNVSLTTELFNKSGELVDSSTQNYNCEKFNPSICNDKPTSPEKPVKVNYPSDKTFDYQENKDSGEYTWKVLGATLVLLLVIIGYVLILKRKKINKIKK